MKQKPYRNEAGHIVFPSPGATAPEAGWPFPELSDEEIRAAGGDPELYRDDEYVPSLFDQHPVTNDDEDEPEDDEDADE